MFSDIPPTDRNDIQSQENQYVPKNYKNTVALALTKEPQSHPHSRVEESTD